MFCKQPLRTIKLSDTEMDGVIKSKKDVQKSLLQHQSQPQVKQSHQTKSNDLTVNIKKRDKVSELCKGIKNFIQLTKGLLLKIQETRTPKM